MENHATSIAYDWLANEEDTYRTCRLYASSSRQQAPVCSQVVSGIWTVEQATRFLLADRLKKFMEEGKPSTDCAVVYSELLDIALSAIDWHEIADAFLVE